MGFSEKIKLAVKKRAAFQCCICHQTGIEVHHIIRQEESGSDEIDNAAPLCPSCHTIYDANPERRKMIREMRDWWYEVCDAKYMTTNISVDVLNEINTKVSEIKKGNASLVPELMSNLKDLFFYSDKPSQNMPPSTLTSIASGIVAGSTGTVLGAFTGMTQTLRGCRVCGKSIWILADGLCSECDMKRRQAGGA